ncbi:MAG: hypothetical protein JJT93_15890 [Gammaproteobacteria bacterium]|nr:hypothetical protein [Gammaproteobacteria bacterium]TVQ46580.1 MAG: hypothetical protein EA371_10065 [Gammaproteobacteria bacterium]
MDKLEAVHRSIAESAGPRPAFFNDPDVDRVLAITMAVSAEVAVMAERLDTLERVLEEKQLVAREELTGYAPDQDVVAERMRWHEAFVSRVLRVVEQELEVLKKQRAD